MLNGVYRLVDKVKHNLLVSNSLGFAASSYCICVLLYSIMTKIHFTLTFAENLSKSSSVQYLFSGVTDRILSGIAQVRGAT